MWTSSIHFGDEGRLSTRTKKGASGYFRILQGLNDFAGDILKDRPHLSFCYEPHKALSVCTSYSIVACLVLITCNRIIYNLQILTIIENLIKIFNRSIYCHQYMNLKKNVITAHSLVLGVIDYIQALPLLKFSYRKQVGLKVWLEV